MTDLRALTVQKTCTADDLLLGKSMIHVGIHGINGSFTDEAWTRFSAEVARLDPNRVTIDELVHSERVLKAVHEGSVDIGIFAFANSGSGGYLASVEAMGRYSYELLGLFSMPIGMCILGHSSARGMEDITEFSGHPVAIAQCRQTLSERWPIIPLKPLTDEMDTALSAKLLSEGALPPTTAVFASRRAAENYGLQILAPDVHHDPRNSTFFAIIRKPQ